jgi:hypothetical protein
MDVHEQRVRFVVEARQKARPVAPYVRRLRSRGPQGYLPLQRYRELGVAGIAEQSRKPRHGKD